MYGMTSFGNYMTPTFAEVFPSDEAFADFYDECGIPKRLLTGDDYSKFNINAIYALLVANYANDHIAPVDVNRFKLQVMAIIYEAGPAWQRAMQIQDKLLTMSDDNIHKGSRMDGGHYVRWDKSGKSINNHAQHPDTEPSDATTNELPYISDQHVVKDSGFTTDDGTQYTTWTKDNVKGLIELLMSLDDTLCTRFIYRFRKLFIKVNYPGIPLLYEQEGTGNGN